MITAKQVETLRRRLWLVDSELALTAANLTKVQQGTEIELPYYRIDSLLNAAQTAAENLTDIVQGAAAKGADQ